MMLLWFIALPFIGGVLSWLSGRKWPEAARWISLVAMVIDLGLALGMWAAHPGSMEFTPSGRWIEQFDAPWMATYGISISLALDGISLLMVLLTAFLGIISIVISWDEIRERVGFFHFNLLWILAGVTGVFLSVDLFLFYVFWEVMIIPMYFLIAIWGHESRMYAATKFFIFTQASGLLMLLAILGLYFAHHAATGFYSFKYDDMLGIPLSPSIARWLMLGFFVAFAVKLPAFPFHTWLPDAHTEAPTAGSVILAGLMLKTGAYGMIRFVIPLFPSAAFDFAPVAMTLGVIGIVYGALLAFGQNDMKRLVAYTSVSHLGFVLLGVFAWNEQALQGAVMQMICHGISTGALFVLVGILQEKIHTRDMDRMGGLWETVPRMGAVAMFFAMASLGLPGLGNFVGEFLVLLGSFRVNATLAIIASIGLVAATVYSLGMMQRAFQGERRESWSITDMSFRHMTVMAVMIASLIWLGLFPSSVLETARSAIQNLQRSVEKVQLMQKARDDERPNVRIKTVEYKPPRSRPGDV